MTQQTPPRRASGERTTKLAPSPEPTAAVPATSTTARADQPGLPAVPVAAHPVVFDPAKHCGAKTSPFTGALPCRKSKGWGTDHTGAGRCRLHFGSSPNLRIHAADEMAQQALDRLGRPRAVAPQRALLECVWEAAGNVAFLSEQASALGVDLTMSVSEITQQRSEVSRTNPEGTKVSQGTTVTSVAWPETTIRGHVVTIREDVRAIVKLYGEWCDKKAKYSAEAIKAGIAEREIRLAEGQADVIVRVVEATLAALSLTPEQREKGRAVASSQLRLIAASPQAASRN